MKLELSCGSLLSQNRVFWVSEPGIVWPVTDPIITINMLKASNNMNACSYCRAEQSEASGIRKGLEILRYTTFRSEWHPANFFRGSKLDRAFGVQLWKKLNRRYQVKKVSSSFQSCRNVFLCTLAFYLPCMTGCNGPVISSIDHEHKKRLKMYFRVGTVVVLLLLWLGLFLEECVTIKNGLIIRRGRFYHVLPEDEYFKLMRGQEKNE